MSIKTIRFEEADDGSELVLRYSPEYRVEYVCAQLGIEWDEDGALVRHMLDVLPDEQRELRGSCRDDLSFVAKHVYHFEQNDIVNVVEPGDEFVFRFATVEERAGSRYWHVAGRILGISQDVLLCVDRRLKNEMFAVGYERRTSVFRKISDVLAPDEAEITIGGTAPDSIPWDDFDNLLSRFPTTALLRHYGDREIADTIGYYLKPRKDYAKAYADSKRKLAAKAPYEVDRIGTDSIRKNFGKSLFESIDLVERQLALGEDGSEDVWQKILLDILPVLYPQYIAVVCEVAVHETISKGGKLTKRRIDHLLIDAAGNVDVLEVKRAFSKRRILRGPYRCNYFPGYELAGGIEQVEKYLHYLNHLGSRGEAEFTEWCKKKLQKQGGPELPEDLMLRCVSPHALLFIGHCEFNEGEQRDFDLIRRQYAHIADIITYDDLLARLKRMAAALEG